MTSKEFINEKLGKSVTDYINGDDLVSASALKSLNYKLEFLSKPTQYHHWRGRINNSSNSYWVLRGKTLFKCPEKVYDVRY